MIGNGRWLGNNVSKVLTGDTRMLDPEIHFDKLIPRKKGWGKHAMMASGKNLVTLLCVKVKS